MLNQTYTTDISLKDLARVFVTSDSRTRSTSAFMVPVADLDLFFEAQIKLHHEPGINPHNYVKTVPICKIEAYSMALESESYWWAKPGLGVEGEPTAGARVVYEKHELLKSWRSPAEVERDHRIDEMED